MDIIHLIWTYLKQIYKSHITFETIKTPNYSFLFTLSRSAWPAPQNININMMPFIVGKAHSIPDKYSRYWNIIKEMTLHCNFGDTAYLTILESWVEPNTQRRPGIHTESPGLLKLPGIKKVTLIPCQGGNYDLINYYGGIVVASNITDSCWVWPCQIQDMGEIVPAGGDIDHLREFLGQPLVMKARDVWWITDGTPHESRPVSQKVYRQFVRVVGSEGSVWFKDHSKFCYICGINLK
jgi:hypothetical protein